MEALQTAPEQIPNMIARAMKNGIDASYVLMDSWFTQQPLIKELTDQGLHVIGIVKKLKQRYLVNGERVSLDQLYRLAEPTDGKNGILRLHARSTPTIFLFSAPSLLFSLASL